MVITTEILHQPIYLVNDLFSPQYHFNQNPSGSQMHYLTIFFVVVLTLTMFLHKLSKAS